MVTLRRFRVLVCLSLLSVGLLPVGAPPAGADHFQPPPGGFFPVSPARLLDTRTGLGAPAAKVGPGQEVVLQVTGRGGVPVDQVGAVTLNVAVTEPTADGYLTAYPTGETRPVASNSNFAPGQTLSTAAVVKLGTGGRVTIFNSAGTSHIVVDVGGWHALYREAGMPYAPVSPTRVFDSRYSQPLGPGGTATVDVSRGVPGVKAVALNVTATGPTAGTFLTAYPAGEPLPVAANLNVVPGQTRGNFVVVKVTDGKVKIYNNSGSTHVVVDLLGHWAPGATSRLHPLTPTRIMDTRFWGPAPEDSPVGAQQTFLVPAAGTMSVEAGAAAAVVLNVAITQPTTDGWITLFPGGSPGPYASNLNYRAGETVSNLVVVPVNDLWHVDVYNAGGPAHLVVDLVGWYDDSLGDIEYPVYEREVPGIVFWGADVVVDPTSTYAFISNTGKDRIEVLRLADGLFEAPIPVGAKPMGLDLSPAGDRLYAGVVGAVSVVDLAARTELARITIPTGQSGNRPFDVAVLANGTALVSTTFDGSGYGAYVFKVDLATGAATLRTDFGSTIPRTWMKSSGDRLSAAVVAGEAPSRIRRYSVATDAFAGPLEVPRSSAGVATDADGSVIIAGGHIMPGTLTQATDIACGTAGVAVTAAGDVAYAIGLTGIRVCNLGPPTLAKNVSLAVDGVGQLVLTPDETRLVGITDTGVVVGKPFV